jgi:hypothetical protein
MLSNPRLDLFYLRYLPHYLHLPLHYQGRDHHHAIIGDGLDVFNLDHFGLNTQFFDRLPRPILELIALRSIHPQNFNLFHLISLHLFYPAIQPYVIPAMVERMTTILQKTIVFFTPMTDPITNMLGRERAGPANSNASAGPLPIPAPINP